MSSRRKQGRPQQRKILDSVEAENDLLVCGHCQTSFPLRDIVLFIKHKNHSCSKENLAHPLNHHHHDDDDDDDDDDGGDEDDEGPTDLSQTTPAGRGKLEGKEEGGKGGGGGGKNVLEKEKMRKPLRPRQVADAEANTTHSEPSRFVCETCGLTVGSAWGLLQHAQKEHGMRIYNTGPPQAGTIATQTPFLATPQPAHTRPVTQALPAHQQRAPEVTSTAPLQKAERPTPPATAGTGPTASFPGVLNPFFRLPVPLTRTSELHIPVDVLEQYRLQPHLLSTVGVTISRAVESPIAHAAFDRTRPLDSQQTYSQRLKELANPTLAATLISPQTGASFTPPVLKPLQPNAQDSSRACRDSSGTSSGSGSSAGSGTGPGGEVKGGEEKRKEKGAAKEKNECSPISKLSSAVSMHLPGKLKTCEFCQKKFRFQSNLIVHRRSHTGEKPFQCPLCPHACSQQSKLRRHMKTHSNGARNGSLTSTTTVSSDGSIHSTSSSPDSTRHKLDDASDMDDEEDLDVEEDDEEEEEEDMEEDFTDGDYDSDMDKGCDNSFNPLTAESNGRSDVCSNSQADTPDAEQAPTPTKRSASASLISEVMKNSGLNCIQSYNEAFQAALEENIGKGGVQDLSRKENGESEDCNRPANGQAPASSAKSVKDESADTNSQETGLPPGVFSPSSFSRCLPADCSSTFRTFFPGFPPTFTLQTAEGGGGSSDKQTGSPSSAVLGVLAVSDSALKVPSASSVSLTSVAKPVSGASLLAASTANSPMTRKSGGRNDTCEFCGKVFKNCSNLTVHRRSHTGEKPYKCELCTYACAQSSKLTRHMKTHGRVGKDVFRCRFCDMPFSVPSTLEKHMRKCVENRNTRVLASPEKGEDGEGVKGMDQDSGSQSSPAPSMPTLSAQLQRQVADSKDSATQDDEQQEEEEDASPGQPAAAVTSPAAQESSGQEDMEVQA